MSHRVAVLVFPGFQLLDAAGPIAAFEVSEPYALRLIARVAGHVRSSSGVAWVAEGLPRASDVDTLLVSGGPGVDAALTDGSLLRFGRRVAGRPQARAAGEVRSGVPAGATRRRPNLRQGRQRWDERRRHRGHQPRGGDDRGRPRS